MSSLPFDRLRRFPDVEAANLLAYDATDRLLLDEAATPIMRAGPGRTAVIADNYGALTLGAGTLMGITGPGQGELGPDLIRVHQDLVTGERALENNRRMLGIPACYRQLGLGAELLTGATVVLLQLPRSLDALAEISDAVARYAAPGVQLYAGGRVKHMSRGMNEVLERYFGEVRAGLGRQKSRVLLARGTLPTPAAPGFPQREYHPDLGLWICAYGSVFAGTKVDIGSRYLLGFMDRMGAGGTRAGGGLAVDLGCGNGLLTAALVKAWPGRGIIATDRSRAAVESTRETLTANGIAVAATPAQAARTEATPNDAATVDSSAGTTHNATPGAASAAARAGVTVLLDDAGSSIAAGTADLVLCNPPFHLGASVHAGAGMKLFDAAARLLRPGGSLWCVFNSHLAYRQVLERTIGPATIMGHNHKFSVVKATRRQWPADC